MARILGVDVPDHMRVVIGLTRIYGIGKNTATTILNQLKINLDTKVGNLKTEERVKIVDFINENYKTEGELRRFTIAAIKAMIDMGSYRGKRHREGRTVRGQRTKNNCRTRKGPKGNMIRRKK